MLKKYILPLFLILLCLCFLLSGAGLFYYLTQASVQTAAAVPIQVDTLSVVVLDDAWYESTFASTLPEEQALAIEESLLQVQALGGNAIALTGRFANGESLFRDSTETIAAASCVTENDTFFTKYDAFAALITAANAYGIEVLLMPTTETGTLCLSASDLPTYLTELTATYGTRRLTPGETLTDYIVSDPITNTTQTLLCVNSDDPLTLALSLQQDTTATTHDFMLGEYTSLCENSTAVSLFFAYYAGGEALPDLTAYLASDYARTLAVTYPTQDGASITSSTVFLMGTSNPDEPLTIDGETIERYGTQGVWGVLVSLSWGSNSFTFTNGEDTLTYSVTRTSSSGTSSSSGSSSYYAVAEGQTIVITSAIASALSSVYNASTITQTFYEGAVLEVTRYLSYSGSSTPYAYQLTTGDYVRAAYCTLYDTARMTLTTPIIAFDEALNATELYFTGGTPAVYHSWEENTLTLTFMTADFDGTLPTADWFTCTAGVTDLGDMQLVFTFTSDEPLYGWAVNYDSEANTTTLTLKQTPHLSSDESLPLAGVRVLLDAGHGLEDTGAMGAGGQDAPTEKDVNLALTMATKYRLEQLGATVILTRDDDSFPTLEDRVSALNSLKPDFFISIHHNSLELVSDINLATGVEAYWFYDEGATFAEDLINAVSSAADRAVRSANYGYYYVTRSNICPATLLEVGFMTNPWEYENIVDVDIIWAEAGAIAQTIYDTVAANGG